MLKYAEIMHERFKYHSLYPVFCSDMLAHVTTACEQLGWWVVMEDALEPIEKTKLSL